MVCSRHKGVPQRPAGRVTSARRVLTYILDRRSLLRVRAGFMQQRVRARCKLLTAIMSYATADAAVRPGRAAPTYQPGAGGAHEDGDVAHVGACGRVYYVFRDVFLIDVSLAELRRRHGAGGSEHASGRGAPRGCVALPLGSD